MDQDGGSPWPAPVSPEAAALAKRKQHNRRVVIGMIVVGVLLAAGAIAGALKKDDHSGRGAFKYRWTNGVCDGDGYSGRFTNTDSADFNGKLWAVAKRGASTVARDEEAVFNLRPGESKTVQFVWVVSDSAVSCSIESVDWAY